ncbi:hypothetical protein [Psychroflexus lacisalsi]|jgi:hypothetical protein|uniref:Uncharacterized protein n=1 Tax=Psychroflexus lacisalsi TaxID=503928 RepID=A0ABP3VKH4_9FLAO|nr:hypothetical protein [Psychroflexus lacisalsi]MBZ9620679.1 hypothetical protein [Psychroflexus lacisalsi]
MVDKRYIQDRKSGFKVSKDYFETLEDSLLNKIKSESYTEKSGFKIPNDYFSDFEVNIPSEEKPTKVIQLKEFSKWMVAASIVAIAVIGALYIDRISPNQNIQFSDLDNDMIERYLDYHLETPDEFIDFENTSVKKLVNQNISKLDDQEIIEYLNDKIEDQDFDNE